MSSDNCQNNVVEEWRPVPGADGLYSVSNLGRVRSEPVSGVRVGRQRGRVLAPGKDTKGYLIFVVCLTGGRRRTVKVHRVVAEAFLGPRPEGSQVNHKDGDKKNNRPDNLEYVTCEDNIRHGWQTGLYRRRVGEDAGHVKLTEDNVRSIRALYGVKTLRELAEVFQVTQATIWNIQHRRSWQHVS